jgi:hypothetical protein
VPAQFNSQSFLKAVICGTTSEVDTQKTAIAVIGAATADHMCLFGHELGPALEAAGAPNLAKMAEWAEAAGREKVTHGVLASNAPWLRRRGAATARGASRGSRPGDPGKKVPRTVARVAQEQQILHGAWSEGFIDGGRQHASGWRLVAQWGERMR